MDVGQMYNFFGTGLDFKICIQTVLGNKDINYLIFIKCIRNIIFIHKNIY